MIVRKKVTLKTKTFLKSLSSNHSIFLSVTHCGNNKINKRRVESTYNLWVTMWLRAKEAIYTMKDQRMKTILNLPAALSGCLPPLRPGLNQTTESDLLRVMRRQTAHDSMLCNAWHRPEVFCLFVFVFWHTFRLYYSTYGRTTFKHSLFIFSEISYKAFA